jgi:hypothetical protein
MPDLTSVLSKTRWYTPSLSSEATLGAYNHADGTGHVAAHRGDY